MNAGINAKNVLITGASGMLGYALCSEASNQGWNVWAIGRCDRHKQEGAAFVSLDLKNLDSVTSLLAEVNPDLVIHAAAITDKSLCEESPDTARTLHVDVSRVLAKSQNERHARFIHISTEAVYGNSKESHDERDLCYPVGVYAETKHIGEQAVLAVNPAALVLRCTPVGFSPCLTGSTLVEWLLRSFKANQQVNGYSDVFFTPITSFQLARFVLSNNSSCIRGVFNIGCSPVMTKYDLAMGLCSELGFDEALVCKATAPGNLTGNASLSSKRLMSLIGWQPPTPKEIINDLTAEFNKYLNP